MNNILQINIFSKPKNMVAKHESCDFLLPIWLCTGCGNAISSIQVLFKIFVKQIYLQNRVGLKSH